MSGFTKLVPEIIQSSIWNESADVRCVWITMLAIKDENGYVRGNATTLSRLANVSEESVDEAINKFTSPDPSSHTPDNEGRRIDSAHGGWIVLNHEIYRTGDRNEYMRKYMQKKRKNTTSVNSVNVNVNNPSVSVSASVGGSAEGGRRKKIVFKAPTPDEVAAYSEEIGHPMNGEAWCDSYAQKGWMVGKNKMKDWKCAVRNWKNQGWLPSAAKKRRGSSNVI